MDDLLHCSMHTSLICMHHENDSDVTSNHTHVQPYLYADVVRFVDNDNEHDNNDEYYQYVDYYDDVDNHRRSSYCIVLYCIVSYRIVSYRSLFPFRFCSSSHRFEIEKQKHVT
jgi:hypothetical protein